MPRNPQLSKLLEPEPESAYTELWLSALSQKPERESLTPLAAEAILKEGKYEILHKIAMGGQGTAYAARRRNTETSEEDTVVVKEYILPTQVGASAKNESIESLKNEAEILARLDHPNIVKLIDFFVQDHRGYIVLEHVDGKTLRELVKENGPLDLETLIPISMQMCRTLSYLHEQAPPVVHRDFTPDNLILTGAGTLKLIDFNVARQTSSTVTATVVGKHAYIALEQFRGKPLPQSDIYSLGCNLHYLSTGEDPEPLSPSSPILVNGELNPELNRIVEKATALDLDERYERADEIMNELIALECPEQSCI